MRDNEAKLVEDGPPGTFVLETEALAGVPARLGGQSWGHLNAARDNAVLVCHYYTGTMRAAGRNPDGTPAWWDTLIGPGKAVDTDRYFVVCLNTFANVQVNDPDVVTTGPDTPHPDGTHWGDRFPAWGFADLHAAQLALMRALHVPRWHAVIGPSFGGIQALQWAARTPHLAPRVAAIAAAPHAGPVLRSAFEPMLQDATRGGGLLGALRVISFFGMGADGLEALFRDANFNTYLKARAGTASAAHILDIGRVVATHDLNAICPEPDLFQRWRDDHLHLLTVNILSDQFFPAAEMHAFHQRATAAGVHHRHETIQSNTGHLGCVLETQQFAASLNALLMADHPQANQAHGAATPVEATRG